MAREGGATDVTTQGGRGRGVDPRQRQGSHSWRTWGRRCRRRWTNLRRRGCWRHGGGLIWRHGGGEGGRMGGGGGGLAHASRLSSQDIAASGLESRGTGKRSRPHASRIFFPWKTQGCGLQFHVSQATKCRNKFARGSLSRGFLARGNHGEPGGIWGFQTSPKGDGNCA